MTISDRAPSRAPYLVTAPTADVRRWHLTLTVHARETRVPWVRVTANCQTEDVWLSIGRSRRRDEEDGA